LERSRESTSLDAKAYRWDRRMKKKCAYCGKEIEEDFRLGQYNGPWLCSEECERRWIEEKENEQKEMRQNNEECVTKILTPLWLWGFHYDREENPKS